MATALRPVLRPSSLPSLPTSTKPTTYVCQSCRHARLLRRPKRPYTFTQLVTLSDGSAFTIRTTSPQPVYRSTRDTRNSPLWNPTSKELLSVEDDEAGRLAGFRARFGTGFDTAKDAKKEGDAEAVEGSTAPAASTETKARKAKEPAFEDEQNMFEEDDMNLLDLISSFGQENTQQETQASEPKKGGKK
ncbi:hypothetical protein HRR83_001003 [Exophiala dermatitidis]|uniref:Ribosomal protein bL31m N-terminal domain-containing protein n=2 Tax=Exophiala dermatitidis TaxID=5970 RepID=H6C7T0_EXODN|nr:uncharacterized protein HMPREF1120_07705 [Exophiala dermatitidis NIH/UT8656]KAJ4522520.1 hypothetical protein HRR75_000914 [Exophiala dermatitidis]EHY59722.1 hypothetical protein HMPREF1120_07705 [Exophiala dermatitidis NIH/UT8656]KAJ4525814.1 hypothetical protein HRR74_001007 [Exophiala dermatitidis]KAJ4527241.1 hypothetical protein HRR73_002038 [Exophiala dermatitidis]KAJ4532968.1 hypothetical protein HRR76_007939 [Exophiala dermatitidis]